jgi:hypothetical protein
MSATDLSVLQQGEGGEGKSGPGDRIQSLVNRSRHLYVRKQGQNDAVSLSRPSRKGRKKHKRSNTDVDFLGNLSSFSLLHLVDLALLVDWDLDVDRLVFGRTSDRLAADPDLGEGDHGFVEGRSALQIIVRKQRKRRRKMNE